MRQKQIVTFHITEYSPTLFYFHPPNFKVFSHHTVFRHFRLYSRFSVRDKFRTHTKQKQYYSHIFQNCLYVFAKKTQGSGTNGCKYASNLTSYLSITPKYVHSSHFLRIYKYIFFITFSYALLMRLNRLWFPHSILDHFSVYRPM